MLDDFLGQIQISVDDLAAGGFEITSYNLLGKKEDSSVDRGSVSFYFISLFFMFLSISFFYCTSLIKFRFIYAVEL